MTPEAAVYNFFGGFGIPAYPATAVPEDATFPYITYPLVVGEDDGNEVNIPATIWYRTSGEAVLNAKAREIFTEVGRSGKTIPCDNGMVWIKRGSPWSQAIGSESDEKVKGRLLNFDLEYLTVE